MNKRDRRKLDRERQRFEELEPHIRVYLDELGAKKVLPARPEAVGVILEGLIGHLILFGQMSEMERFGLLVAADVVEKILDYGKESTDAS